MSEPDDAWPGVVSPAPRPASDAILDHDQGAAPNPGPGGEDAAPRATRDPQASPGIATTAGRRDAEAPPQTTTLRDEEPETAASSSDAGATERRRGQEAAPATVRDVDATLQDESVRELTAQFEDEKPGRRLRGPIDAGVTVVAAASALLVLWQVFRPLPQGGQYYLAIFLSCVLPLVFVVYPSGIRARRTPKSSTQESPTQESPTQESRTPESRTPATGERGPTVGDWLLTAVAFVACAYPLLPFASGGYNAFLDRQGQLDPLDVAMGTALLVLVLEACRRTTGWVLPVVCGLFLAYDYYGGYLPQHWSLAHQGLNFDQIVDALYNSQSGFYGTPLDVAASYIVLFTIYGAVLDASGAGAFFVELSVAAFRRSRSAAGRTAVASGFLLGTVSGSGAATTVSIGAVTWPILRRAGYPSDRAGGMLAAAGVGAILSPPTLGAAAFIIAEFLDVSYLAVLGWATIPTLLYYLGILLAVEIDARRFGARPVQLRVRSPWALLGRFGYHFASLLVIIVLLALEQPATRAVIYATLLAALLSFLDRRHRLTPRRLVTSLAAGVRGVLPVVAVCVAAGIITSSTTKTGLGPQMSGLMVEWAQSLASGETAVIALTAVFAAIALTLLGLAVPVTASFIIGWVIIGQALLELGIDKPATAMFIFYFAVLSEATPPTALAAVAAAAVTGGRVFPTMWQTLRYALPAYLVPLAFIVTPAGRGLLGFGGWDDIGFAFVASALGVFALSAAAGGWLLGVGAAGPAPRVIAGAAALALLWLSTWTVVTGVVLLLLAALLVYRSASRARPDPSFPSSKEEPT